MKNIFIKLLIISILASCNHTQESKNTNTQTDSLTMKTNEPTPEANFGTDANFLQKYDTTAIILANENAQIVVSPQFQGRVMTATAQGLAGQSTGWLNYELIKSGKLVPHINAYGGADRFWLGPEGGQYAIFFKKGETFDGANWQTPAPIDAEPFDLVSKDNNSVKMQKKMQLTNYAGTQFDLRVDRTIRLLGATEVSKLIDNELFTNIQFVAFQSENQITNTGKTAWTKETGLLSIWILGMFNASDNNTVVVPIVEGEDKTLGIKVNDDYFGKLSAEKLVAKEKAIFFKADSKLRSKIGVSALRSKDIMGSYNADKQLLTVVKFSYNPQDKDYINSQWKIQENPYSGDVSNSYNDDGNLGRVYELETSSPAKALKPNESISHIHSTFHFTGDAKTLDAIAQKLLGVGLEEINAALPK